MSSPTAVLIGTERLFLRNWTPSDVDDYLTLLAAYGERPEDHTGEELWGIERTREFIELAADRPASGDGTFHLPLVLKHGHRLIGSVALLLFDDLASVPEIEWDIGPAYWNKGYATEIGRAVLRYAFDKAGFSKVAGFTRPGNDASCRVMEKIGMVPKGTREIRGGTYLFYEIAK